MQAVQVAAEGQAANLPATEAIAIRQETTDTAMDVDGPADRGTKRKADDDNAQGEGKKARLGLYLVMIHFNASLTFIPS